MIIVVKRDVETPLDYLWLYIINFKLVSQEILWAFYGIDNNVIQKLALIICQQP